MERAMAAEHISRVIEMSGYYCSSVQLHEYDSDVIRQLLATEVVNRPVNVKHEVIQLMLI